MRPLRVHGPFFGINKDESSILDPREAEDALNVDLDKPTLLKRPGHSIDGTGPSANPVLGLFDFGRDDGQRFQLVKLNGALYKFAAGVFTSLGVGLSTSEYARFVVIENKVVVLDPGDDPKIWDGTAASFFDLLLESPDDYGPDLALAAGAGVLTGTYDYKYTYYSSSWGIESAASPALKQTPGSNERFTQIQAAQQAVQLTNWVLPVDSRVDKFRIYRRKASALQADWFFVEEIAKPTLTTTVYVDNVPDSSVSTRIIAPLTFSATLPAAKFAMYHEGVSYLGGLAGFPKRLLISAAGKPFAPVEAFDSITGTGDLTGLEVLQGQRLAFTEEGVWVISGPRSRLAFLLILPKLGCIAPHSIVSTGDAVYFFSQEGFFEYDLGEPRELSRNIRPLIKPSARNPARDPHMVGVHLPDHAAILWIYSGAGSSVHNRGLVYFYGASRERKEDIWCPWEFPSISHLAGFVDSATKQKKVRLGFTNGKVGTLGGENDDTAAIRWFWQTGAMDFGDPWADKAFGNLGVEFSKQSGCKPVDIQYLLDSSSEIHTAGRHKMERENYLTRLRRRGKELRLRLFQEEKDAPIEVLGWEVQAYPTGRSHA